MHIILKLCGILCVFGACLMAGYELERSLKERWLFLREVKEVLQLMEKEMTWHRTALPEALKNASAGCRTSLGSVLRESAKQAESHCGLSFREIWKENTAKQLPEGLLNDAQYQAFLELEAAFCNTDTILQKTQLQKYEQRFEDLSGNAHADWREKGRLYRQLSVAAGLMAVIWLL